MATTQELFDETECFGCIQPMGNAQRLRIGLLLQILANIGTVMSPQELMTAAACFVCLDGVSQGDAIEIALLNELAGGGGSGGIVAQQVYEGRDPAPPDDPTKPAISFVTGGGTITQWPANGPAWV